MQDVQKCNRMSHTNSFELKCIRVAFVLDIERAYEDKNAKDCCFYFTSFLPRDAL